MYDRIRFYMKKPGNGRASFSILKDVVKVDGKRQSEIVKDERIGSLNKLYKLKLKDITSCEIELADIISQFYKEIERKRGTYTFNNDNHRILENYWKQRYEHKPNVDLSSAKNELIRAIEALGPTSLISTQRDVLQKKINTNFKGNAQRRIVSSLNQMLRYSGRDIQLALGKKERNRIKHLNEKDFQSVLSKVTDETYKLFFATCFGTGCRSGEAFAMLEMNHHNDVIFIETQLDREEIEGPTKNRRVRNTIINPNYIKYVKKWIALSSDKKSEIRTEKHAEVLKAACIKAFPGDSKKICTVKDLRHSYAVWLLSKKVGMTWVAQNLGNSILTCQEYYAGFDLAPDSIEAIRAILKGQSP